MGRIATVAVILAAVALAGCTYHTVKVEPIEVKPIQITVDVLVKVDRQLDDFFDYQDENGTPSKGTGGQP